MTAEKVRADFNRRGISISQWARDQGFSPNQVFEVLAGRNRGLRGKAHRIAVLLRLKREIARDAKG